MQAANKSKQPKDRFYFWMIQQSNGFGEQWS